jgi:hypothetical protein
VAGDIGGQSERGIRGRNKSLWMVSGRGEGVIFEREGISDRGYYTTAAPLVHNNLCQSNPLGTAFSLMTGRFRFE